jgi:hypothetical protein
LGSRKLDAFFADLAKLRPRVLQATEFRRFKVYDICRRCALRFNDTIRRNSLNARHRLLTPHHRFNTRSQEELAVVTRDVRLPENPGQRLKA